MYSNKRSFPFTVSGKLGSEGQPQTRKRKCFLIRLLGSGPRPREGKMGLGKGERERNMYVSLPISMQLTFPKQGLDSQHSQLFLGRNKSLKSTSSLPSILAYYPRCLAFNPGLLPSSGPRLFSATTFSSPHLAQSSWGHLDSAVESGGFNSQVCKQTGI